MPDWLFDTTALIDYYCGRPGIRPYFEAILQGQATGAFSTISELELWQGIRPGEEERHKALLALLIRIPLDGEIARLAGLLRQEVGLEKLSLPDAAIAATAIYTRRVLVSRNTHHFKLVAGKIPIEFYEK